MSYEPPAPMPVSAPPPPLQPMPQPQQKSGCARWLIVSLIGCGLVVLVIGGIGGFFAYRAWKMVKSTLSGAQQLAPATPAGQGCFTEAPLCSLPGDVTALTSGPVGAKGATVLVAVAGGQVTLLDLAGKQLGAFPCGLAASTSANLPTFIANLLLTRLRTGVIHKQPAVIVSSYADPAVIVYDTSGKELWRNSVTGAQVASMEVADLDGDGESEVLVGRASQQGLTCFSSDGAVRWTYNPNTQPMALAVADTNVPGKRVVHVGTMAAPVVMLDSAGRQIGGWSATHLEGQLAAADLDRDLSPDFLAVASDMPSGPSAGASGSSFNWQSVFQLKLLGLASDGTEKWHTALGMGIPAMTGALLDAGDADGDGQGEWLVCAPDGTLRVYSRDGAELCRQGLGRHLTGLAVTPPEKKGGRARLWVSAGKEVLGLEWQKWTTASTTPTTGAAPTQDAAPPKNPTRRH